MENKNYKNNKVYIFCHYAQQPPYNTMHRYHNWGKELIKRGYDVTIISASVVHNTNVDVIDEIGRTESISEGVNYSYLKTPKYSGNGLGRIKNMISFCIKIKRFKNKHKIPDYIISSDAYVFPFVKNAYKKRPIIVDITDLWPTSIIQYCGISKYNPIIQLLFYIEKKAYIKSDALIFSMEGGIDYVNERKYKNRVIPSKIFHINMGCDIEKFDLNKNNKNYILQWDPSKFNIVYCGSIRTANQVLEICQAAEELQKRGYNDLYFHIYGNGDQLDNIKEYAVLHSIKNISFYGRIEKEKIPYILSNSTVNLLTYKKVDLMKYGGSQSKLFDYLTSGRPIISNADWGYNLITRYSCGIVTDNQSSSSFADAIEQIYKMSEEERRIMGNNSRKASENYSQPILVDKLCEVFEYCSKK